MTTALLACGGASEEEEEACTPVGEGEPRVVALVENTTEGGFRELNDGGEVHLWRPVQGGHVIYVGARVSGLCADPVLITGRIKDLATGNVVSKEMRRGFGLIDQGDATLLPDPTDLGAVANIALCPELTGEHDVMGTQFLLEVEVEDAEGRVARAQAKVTPVCAQTDEAGLTTCQCECTRQGSAGGCG